MELPDEDDAFPRNVNTRQTDASGGPRLPQALISSPSSSKSKTPDERMTRVCEESHSIRDAKQLGRTTHAAKSCTASIHLL